MSLTDWFIKNRHEAKTELEGLEKAQSLLDERHRLGQVSNEVYQKQSLEFMKKKEKYLKKLDKENRN